MNLLALDIGMTSVKAAVLDRATAKPVGDIVTVGFALDTPTPDAVEVPAARLWQAAAQAARSAVQQTRVAGQADDVAGVGLSTIMPALVLLDQNDKPCAPIWMPADRRARPSARHVGGAVGEEFLASTGNRPVPGVISALNFRQQLVQEPYFLHDVRSYLHLNGWLAFHMTGQKTFDPANASCSGLYSAMTDRRWSPRWCEFFEVEPAWLPPVASGAATVGHLRSAIAAELGVPAGVPVKSGTATIGSAMLAEGMQPGDLYHEVGTIQTMAMIAHQPVPSPQRLTYQLGVGDRFIHVAHNAISAVAFDWVRQLCFREQSAAEFFDRTIPQALERQPRVSFDPPFLAGNPLEIEATRASFRDLELTTDRLDLLAALLHALTRRHREALASLGQETSYRRIFLTGDSADLMRRLLPGYENAQVERVEEGSLRGVAKLFDEL